MDLKKLAEKMPYKERKGPGGKMLSYITARQAQDRLDEICGPENWKIEYKEIAGNLFAGVSILCGNTEHGASKEWVTKWDAGSESNIEKEKGHISDSFKRACVCWGIGRFLYGELQPEKKQGIKDPELSQLDCKEWVDRFEQETDINALKVDWETFQKGSWSTKQVEWANRVKEETKRKLT